MIDHTGWRINIFGLNRRGQQAAAAGNSGIAGVAVIVIKSRRAHPLLMVTADNRGAIYCR